MVNSKPLSSTQLIYTGINRLNSESDPQRVCRICGGPLLLPEQPMKKISDSWTDENLCLRKDSEWICAACSWFTEGKNRTQIWNGKQVLYATQNENITMTIPEFHSFLQGDFETPAVFMVRGKDPNLIRKHIQWRAINNVTYSRKQVKVLLYGLQVWKTGQIIGTAFFDTDEMLKTINVMQEKSTPYINLLIDRILAKSKKKKSLSEWFIQNLILENLLDAVADDMNTDIFLAAYIASNLMAVQILEER